MATAITDPVLGGWPDPFARDLPAVVGRSSRRTPVRVHGGPAHRLTRNITNGYIGGANNPD